MPNDHAMHNIVSEDFQTTHKLSMNSMEIKILLVERRVMSVLGTNLILELQG